MTISHIGYARISTIAGQKLDLQTDALAKIGCRKIFCESVSGAATSRPELDKCLSYLREGDVLVVYKLDRLGRSLKHLLSVIEDLKQRNIGFKSITDGIDTTTPSGLLMFNIIGSFAEFERTLIQERTQAGLKAARERGKLGGRPRAITPPLAGRLTELHRSGKSVENIAQELGIGRATVYRYLRGQQEPPVADRLGAARSGL